MGITLDPTVRYTTQRARYEALVVGKDLNDKRIRDYMRKGWYGQDAQLRVQRNDAIKKRKHDKNKKIDLSQYDML